MDVTIAAYCASTFTFILPGFALGQPRPYRLEATPQWRNADDSCGEHHSVTVRVRLPGRLHCNLRPSTFLARKPDERVALHSRSMYNG